MTGDRRQDPIKLVPYDDGWPAAFEQQRPRVEAALARWIVGPVEHIGSTSIPGMTAKPIIDMLARVPDHRHTTGIVEAMAGIGWTHAPEPGDDRARKWSFCFPDIAWRTHHLHIFQSDPSNWQFLLTFRDHLRTHPGDAAEYGRLKVLLAAADPDDRPRYRSGKAPFITDLLKRLEPPSEDTKVHAVADVRGQSLATRITPGQASGTRQLRFTLRNARKPRTEGLVIAGRGKAQRQPLKAI